MKRGITRSSHTHGRRSATPPASGTFVLRLGRQLHGLLRRDAAAADTSLNDWCGRTLAAPGGCGLAAAAEVVLPIRARLGADLVGIILHGSCARGELSAGSDVDLLVVLGEGVSITRKLYREWEGVVPAWEGREVDLHFVHLPGQGTAVTGSWAEAAVCGIVLVDRDMAVSRRLIEIRSRIAAGELSRRLAQGQPYWVHEASDAQS